MGRKCPLCPTFLDAVEVIRWRLDRREISYISSDSEYMIGQSQSRQSLRLAGLTLVRVGCGYVDGVRGTGLRARFSGLACAHEDAGLGVPRYLVVSSMLYY